MPAPVKTSSAPRSIGYATLVRTNVNFRRLWAGNTVSLLGDWFNTIALYTLVFELTGNNSEAGSPLALAGVFIFKLLPWALASPLAGVLVDRYNRRWLMIGSDVLRALIVLCFLFIDTPSELPWLYVLITLQVVVGAVFIPAKSASLPNITAPHELLTANALSAATWSSMLAIGAALGGFATAWLGVRPVFLLDACTYLVSGFFIYRATIPQDTTASDEPLFKTAYREILDGWQHLRTHPPIGRIALSKASWAVGGGALVFTLALMGDRFTETALAAGIGLLFMARGIGTGIGPIVARAVFEDERHWPAVMGACVMVSGVCYGIVSFLPWLPWNVATYSLLLVIVLVVMAHGASGANWVLTSVLLQKRTADRYRGRVFATEWLLLMVPETVSILLAALLLEAGWLDLRAAVWVFAWVQILCGLAWLLLVVPRERLHTVEQEEVGTG